MADPFTIKQGDTAPALSAILKGADGNPQPLTGATVKLNLTGVRTLDHAACTIDDAAGGVVHYDWQTADTVSPGTCKGEFEVTLSDGHVITFPNSGSFTVVIKPQLE